MKKSKRNIFITVIVLIVLCIGGYYIYNAVSPVARTLEYPNDFPSVEEVLTVTISTSDGKSTEVYNFASLIMQIGQVEPTRKESVNDVPAAEFYYKIELATEDKEYCYFVYEENGQVYLEIPYLGIYKGLHNSGSNSLMEIIADLLANHSAE